MVRLWTYILLSLLSPLCGANDRTVGQGGQANTILNEGSPFKAGEMKCLLEKVGTKSDHAQKAAEAIEQAAKILKMPNDKFTRASMIHFLTMIKGESDAGRVGIELKPKSKELTGYGMLQVTGQGNLEAAEKCMNDAQNNFGTGISKNPAAMAKDLLKSAAASLCWWKTNMVQNAKHVEIQKGNTAEDYRKVLQICNSGRIGGPVTGGEAMIRKRQETFLKVSEGERECRG